jgi:aminoglycoside phosphotransferase (APT) family kinase protein
MTRLSSSRPPTRVPAAPSTGPRDVATLDPVPHGRTARRLDWTLLPPAVRRRVEDLFGTPVVSARSAGAGYTPGCASVLTGADGRRIFLKAASTKAQRPFADAYADEIRNLRALPTGVPAPRLLWSHEDDLWVLLGLEHVDGANPARPWDGVELGLCLDTLEVLAQTLTPPPMALRPFAEDFADLVPAWDHVRRTSPEWPHLEEAAALAAGFRPGCEGETLVHTDARDDNFLVGPDGLAHLCDWNWPVVGAPWIDTVCLLMTAYGDGLDADALLAERALTRDVPPDDIDALLALLCGYFLERRDQPVPHSSPYLRRHQDWCAEVTWAWLSHRRAWT